MEDFLTFKKMVTPVIIQIVFWISVVFCVYTGINLIVGAWSDARFGGGELTIAGLLWMFLGPLAVRIYCELLIVIFSINDTLTDTRNILRKDANEAQ